MARRPQRSLRAAARARAALHRRAMSDYIAVGADAGDVAGGLLNIYNQGEQAQGARDILLAQQQARAAGLITTPTPSWVMPAAVGAGLLVLLVVLKRRR